MGAVAPGKHTVRIIGTEVPLRAGALPGEFMGRCPFHEETTESLVVWEEGPRAGLWRCFGCGCEGDALRFIAMLYKESVADAALSIHAALLVQP